MLLHLLLSQSCVRLVSAEHAGCMGGVLVFVLFLVFHFVIVFVFVFFCNFIVVSGLGGASWWPSGRSPRQEKV